MGSKEPWVLMFVFWGLLYSWPFMSIFESSMPYYLFGTWAALIGCVLFAVRKANRRAG